MAKQPAVSAKGIASADKQIAMLKDRLLPYDPHIVTVPTDFPYRGGFDYENKGTPFEDYEVRALQYVTLVGETDRDTARPWPAAEWMDVIEARSPASLAARSNTTTPNAAAAMTKEPKVPRAKISLGDYKKKLTGVRASPNPSKVGHERTNSQVSGGEPLSRDNSFEGMESRQNGASSSFSSTRGAAKAPEKPVQVSALPHAKPHPPATTNGHTHTHTEPRKDASHPYKESRYPQEPIKHSLPPRPVSPPRSNPTQKRPLESADTIQPEKRSKIEHTRTPSNSQNHSRTPSNSQNHVRTPSGSQNHLPRKPNTPLDPKPSPLKSQSNSQTHSSPQKKTPVTKAATKDTRPNEGPFKPPPLLSPLPADLAPAPNTGFPTKKAEAKKSAQGPPSKCGLGADTIVVRKAPSPLAEIPQTSRASPEAFELPPLLSPTLPDIVEQELLRLQQKSVALSTESRLNSVEARHEKVRRPDTPGVARKTTTPKVGHPPKKTPAESSKSHEKSVESSNGTKPSLIAKLKYKKRKANDIARILGMRPRPSQEFVQLERARVAKEYRPEEDSDEDEPISRTASKAPVSAKKRPIEATESRAESSKRSEAEPPPKRQKLPEIDIAKSKTTLEPAFKSPAMSQPSQKSLLSTPKKPDSSKSAAMRKVNSSDGHAYTPQTSTPASAEKPRLNGITSSESKKELGTYIKRKMDSILHLKDGKRESVSETNRKLGLSVALECIAVYMIAFASADRINKRRSTKDWESVIQLWEFINGLAKHTILQRLSFELGALCREELGRAYNERLTEKFDPELAKLFAANASKRDRAWFTAHNPPPIPSPVAGQSAVMDPGPMLRLDRELGPWTSMAEAKEYTFEVLEMFDRRERTGWRATESVSLGVVGVGVRREVSGGGDEGRRRERDRDREKDRDKDRERERDKEASV